VPHRPVTLLIAASKRLVVPSLAAVVLAGCATTNVQAPLKPIPGVKGASYAHHHSGIKMDPKVAKPGMLVGLTHTEFSADPGGNPDAVSRAKKLLRQLDAQNQFIMGFGVANPEPSPGVFHWKTLDQRVKLMRRTTPGNRPVVLTLCCAPDWMKGGKAGHTDWSKIDQAPTPSHYQDFADLAAAVAARYPQVHYFQVWSELRGFYDHGANAWNMANYTAMYNDVYKAVKAVNPAIKVGGPYVNMASCVAPYHGCRLSTLHGKWGTMDRRSLDAITYWLAHKAGADFLSVDGGPRDSNYDPPLSDYKVALGKLRAADRWMRHQTSLPIWWSEVKLSNRTHYDPNGGLTHSATATVRTLRALAESGSRVALLWCGERCFSSIDGGRGMWSATNTPDGGVPTLVDKRVVHTLGRWRHRPFIP
jgi:hypothetical protein